ncbi:MAG: hypothetical protein GY715_05590 [Planctomycetes bacterium]|nr:hypothetical protein [Planctomycetota bacterium]
MSGGRRTRWSVPVTLTAAALVGAVTGGCDYSQQELLAAPVEQASLRAMQTRSYAVTDERLILRTIIATLQDLGFVINDGNAELGLVSGTRLIGGAVRIMVTIRADGPSRTLVRASAQYSSGYGFTVVIDPQTYEEFFNALSRSLALEGQPVE